MCGIAGIVNTSDRRIIQAMTTAIAHRGPDHLGYYYGEKVHLGHARLSILDTGERAHQPFISPDGNYVLVFNGEIYNHQELRKELKDKYAFTTTCDTETLLFALIEYGMKVLPRLNGIFAFAFLDVKEQQLYLVKDRFGVKPLYLYQDEEGFAFASEIKAFLALPNLNKSIDYEVLTQYLRFQYAAGEGTPFVKVRKLPPATVLKLDLHAGNTEEDRFYTPDFTKRRISFVQAKEELLHLLRQAMNRQHQSDVPVGYLLSGGLDSSAILRFSLDYQTEGAHAFTFNNPEAVAEGFGNDVEYARKLATQWEMPLKEATADNITSELDRMVYHLDEPIGDPAAFSMLTLSKLANTHGNKVLLSGTGADDIFSGYRRHQALHYQALKPFVSLLPQQIMSVPMQRRVARFRQSPWSYFSTTSARASQRLMGTEWGSSDPFERYWNSSPLHDLDKMLWLEQRHFLADNNLVYMDKLSMAHGVELRVPFLDNDLVQFANALPTDLKMKGTTTKYVLREALKPYLPREIISRSKTGFGMSLRTMLATDKHGVVHNYLSTGPFPERGIFNIDNVNELIEQNREGKVDGAFTIWSLICIESWLRQFVD